MVPGRRQGNQVGARKGEHSRKPDEFYDMIEARSPVPRLELFARGTREGGRLGEIGNCEIGYRLTRLTRGLDSSGGDRISLPSPLIVQHTQHICKVHNAPTFPK